MGRNHTGPPCSVYRPTAHAPGPSVADCQRAQQPAHPQRYKRRQTMTTTDNIRQQAEQYWPIRQASNNSYFV